MINKNIKSIFNSPSRKLLVTNFFSLSIIQGANYLIPLLVLPYILRIIGPEKFGLLSYAQTFVYYFTIIVNYSFDYTATRDISIHRDSRVEVSKIYSSVFYCKLLLFGISTAMFFLTVIFIPHFREDSEVYFVTYLINIGFVFFPSWFFQGVQQLNITAFFNLIAKVLFAVALILMIKEESDFLIFAVSNSAAQILVGLAAFFYGLYFYKIKLVKISFSEFGRTLKGGVSIFFSSVAVSLYTNTNLIILGWYISETQYGYFSAALKIALVIQSLVILPLGMTLFPHIGRSMQRSSEEGIQLLTKYIKWVALCTLILSLLIFFLAEELIVLLFGQTFLAGAHYLRILAFMPLVSGINNMVSVQGLINLKKDKQYLFMTLIIFAISLALNIWLVPLYQGTGTAVILISSEVLMTVIASFYLFKGFAHRLKR